MRASSVNQVVRFEPSHASELDTSDRVCRRLNGLAGLVRNRVHRESPQVCTVFSSRPDIAATLGLGTEPTRLFGPRPLSVSVSTARTTCATRAGETGHRTLTTPGLSPPTALGSCTNLHSIESGLRRDQNGLDGQ